MFVLILLSYIEIVRYFMKLLHNFATKKCKVVTYQIFLSLTAQEAFKPLVVYQNLNSMRLLGQVPDKPWDVLFYARFRLRSLSLFFVKLCEFKALKLGTVQNLL